MDKLLNTFSHLFGFDVFIERDDPRCGLLEFERKNHSNGDRECWGLGLHLVMSPL